MLEDKKKFEELLKNVWNEDCTDETEGVYFLFFKAGYSSRDKEIESLKCCGNCGNDTNLISLPDICFDCDRIQKNKRRPKKNCPDNWKPKNG